MIIQLTFKTPDVLDQVDDQITDRDDVERAKAVCEKWLEYGEYVRIEIDTEKGTAEVMPQS